MKRTIKEDQERFILKSEMINDNSLLEYTADQGKMIISVRFVDSSKIKENIILSMDIVEYMKHQENLIEFNEDKSAIAVFKPTTEGYSISYVYDFIEHQSASPEFIDLEYENRFGKKLIKRYLKQK